MIGRRQVERLAGVALVCVGLAELLGGILLGVSLWQGKPEGVASGGELTEPRSAIYSVDGPAWRGPDQTVELPTPHRVGNPFGESRPLPFYALRGSRWLRLIAFPDVDRRHDDGPGYAFVIANAGAGTLYFDSLEGMLSIRQEARDESGEWRPIECQVLEHGSGNTTVGLPSREYWELSAPRYRGRYRTRIRLALETYHGTFHSNSFEGSIDPEQFVDDCDRRGELD